MTYQATARENIARPANAVEILGDCRDLYLKKLSQLLKEGERLPASAVKAFENGVGRYFDAKTSAPGKSDFAPFERLTASSIALVGESDLELEIRLGEFTTCLLEKTAGELWQVYLRFVTLLDHPNLSTSDNPVGPKGIARGLSELCADMAENHEKTLERVKRLESHFADNLTVLYGMLDDFFVERYVEAALPSVVTSPESARAAVLTNPAAVLQRNLLGPNANLGSHADNTGLAAASLLSQAMLDRLLMRLEALETRLPTPLTATSPAEQGIPTPRTVNANQLGIPSNAPEAATIDALALIFEAIFATENLPAMVKSLLSSLQIPLFKAAMLDNSFFTADSHPARLLLDKMARAALGLPLNASANHPLCSSLQRIASHVRSEFTHDTQVFRQYSKQLDHLISNRDEAAACMAAAYHPLLDEFERQNQATLRCHQIIEAFCHSSTPQSITAFLREYGQKRLQTLWLAGGEHGEAWKAHIAAIEQLLWCIQPKVDINERKKLTRIVPGMLKQLTSGMDSIGLDEEAKNTFLDHFFALQTAALSGASPQEEATATPISNEPTIEMAVINLADQQLRTIRQIINHQLSTKHAIRLSARIGDWVDFSLADEYLCGRLGWISEDKKILLLNSPDWPFAVAMQSHVLAGQLRDKRARIASSASLFNCAAEKALRGTPKNDVLA